MTTRALLLLLALATAACGGTGERARPAAVAAPPGPVAAAPVADARPRIVFFGDSLTRGLGLPPEQAIPALIQERLDAAGYAYQAVNQGNSGDTSAAGLRRLDLALEGDVRVLVLELGANDMLRFLQPAQMRDNLRAIIERCRARDVAVLLTGMEALPNLGPDYTREFREVFRELAEEYDLVFMPFFLEDVAGDPSLNQSDMMHPNAEGARIVADNLWSILESML